MYVDVDGVLAIGGAHHVVHTEAYGIGEVDGVVGAVVSQAVGAALAVEVEHGGTAVFSGHCGQYADGSMPAGRESGL